MNVIWADKNASGPLKLVPCYEYRHPRLVASPADPGSSRALLLRLSLASLATSSQRKDEFGGREATVACDPVIALPCTITGSPDAASGLASMLPGRADRV
jgi:hypothetical protein